jgi:hypothetical protein
MNNKKDFVNRIFYTAMLQKLRELLVMQKTMQHDKGTGYYKAKRFSKGLRTSNKT